LAAAIVAGCAVLICGCNRPIVVEHRVHVDGLSELLDPNEAAGPSPCEEEYPW